MDTPCPGVQLYQLVSGRDKYGNMSDYLDDWLTVHHSITSVDLHLEARISCLFTYNTFIKILYMFRALSCSSSGVFLVFLSCLFSIANLDDWLTVHRSITLVDLHLDAQNNYLFTFYICLACLALQIVMTG